MRKRKVTACTDLIDGLVSIAEDALARGEAGGVGEADDAAKHGRRARRAVHGERAAVKVNEHVVAERGHVGVAAARGVKVSITGQERARREVRLDGIGLKRRRACKYGEAATRRDRGACRGRAHNLRAAARASTFGRRLAVRRHGVGKLGAAVLQRDGVAVRREEVEEALRRR